MVVLSLSVGITYKRCWAGSSLPRSLWLVLETCLLQLHCQPCSLLHRAPASSSPSPPSTQEQLLLISQELI